MKTVMKIATVAAAAFGATSAPVSAFDGRQESATAFYSDESETTIVGWNIMYCDGTFVHTGMRTLYTETFYFGCS